MIVNLLAISSIWPTSIFLRNENESIFGAKYALYISFYVDMIEFPVWGYIHKRCGVSGSYLSRAMTKPT
jgi:hypothetical protein